MLGNTSLMKLLEAIINAKYLITGFWILLAVSLVYFALQYENKTSMYFAAPKNSLSY